MSTTHLNSIDRFPSPHRAPGPLDELSGGPPADASITGSDPGRRRYQRAVDGWIATRIRKQARHWRQR
ncbi:MAG TPA: hypothetical protein VGF70_14735 [Solirubrobacteraceae bacterium]